MANDRPLAGLRVIDLADEKAELSGRLLADFGADVIRVEAASGARSRTIGPFHEGESLHFAYRNAGKRGVVLDLDDASGREQLDALLAGADVLIDSARPDALPARGLEPARLTEQFPRLITLQVTDFGLSGPYRDWVGTDAVLEAMGGLLWKAGVAHKEPLLPPTPLAYDLAGIVGAFAVLLALHHREDTGYGQHIDFPVLQAAAQATDWSFCSASVQMAQGGRPVEVRAGSGPLYTIYACKGGYVRLVILSPRQWRAMWEWLGEPEAFADPFFESFIARLQNADVLMPLYTEHFSTMTMDEVSAEAQRRGIVCTPVLRPEEVLANEHLQSRGTFAANEWAKGIEGPMPSGFQEIDGVRQGPRSRAPEPGEHQEAVFADLPSPQPAPSEPRPAPSLPLSGLRVLDFGIGGVGVEGCRMLADYGADVIKVETETYPDFIRVVLSTPISPSFASSSRTKRGFGVNLKKPEGLALVHKLIEDADVIIENSKTGAMDEMGVGYAKVKELNPRCVMISSQLLGSHGAWKDWIGYGPSTQPIGGMVHLWNYDDQEDPAGSTAIFPDHLAGRVVAINALASLWARRTTGVGAHSEVAQVETVVGVLGDLLGKAALEPGSVGPRGNKTDRGAPWGVFPCAGDQQWCVISVRDDADWAAFARAIGNPDWAQDAGFATAAGRLAERDALHDHVRTWTAERTKQEVAETLQAAGVPAGPMFTGADQVEDAHLLERGFVRWIDQQVIGRMAFEGPAFAASGISEIQEFQAPLSGEHTREICRELGVDDAEVERLLALGALEEPKPA
ncbi:MAG: CoA transferase [Myxococcota bacterium]